jgi:hypothetical protein
MRTQQRFYQNRHIRVIAMLLAVAVTTSTSLIAFTGRQPLSSSARLGIAGLGVGYSAFLVIRAARSGVYADQEGVLVRGLVRSVWVPWSDIRCFLLDKWGFSPLSGYVELRSGRRVHLTGIGELSPLFFPKAHVASILIAQLNEELVAALHVPEAPDPRDARPS